MEIRARPAPTVSTRKAYPTDSVPRCGDEWCLNGPPGPSVATYWLCKTCQLGTPDAIKLGYNAKPSKMKPGERNKINSSVFMAFVMAKNKIEKN